ncbi:MAG TPA: GNAT family N-acetyltransferase [Ignavibacteria bacterium]|nr:GNAT family N-acetyltransferase [Ignavibacteria bacterium]
MIRISKLTMLSMDDLLSMGNPAFEVKATYDVICQINEEEILFSLKYRESKNIFNVKTYSNSNEDKGRYYKLIPEGNSFGAFDNEKLIGFVISEKRQWNNSLWIEMIQIAKSHRGKGIGTQLLNNLEAHAATQKYRIIDIETQNTNVPAINFYRKNGYEITGLNTALYDPKEVDNEIAIYMAKNLL